MTVNGPEFAHMIQSRPAVCNVQISPLPVWVKTKTVNILKTENNISTEQSFTNIEICLLMCKKTVHVNG